MRTSSSSARAVPTSLIQATHVGILNICIALATVYLAWGSAFLAIKTSLVIFSPMMLMAIRFIVAGIALTGFYVIKKGSVPKLNLLRETIIGVLLVGSNSLVAVAQKHVDSAYAAILVALVPVWVLFLGSIRGEQLVRTDLQATFLAFVGIVVLKAKSSSMHSDLIGTAILVVSTIGWSVGTVLSRNTKRVAPVFATGFHFLIGGVAILILAKCFGEQLPTAVGLKIWFPVAYLIGFCSIAAYISYSYLLNTVSLAVATSYAYVCPVVAVTLGVVLGAEQLANSDYIGLALVLFALIMLLAKKRACSTK